MLNKIIFSRIYNEIQIKISHINSNIKNNLQHFSIIRNKIENLFDQNSPYKIAAPLFPTLPWTQSV